MKIIYKYEVYPKNESGSMPKGAIILHAGVQNNTVFVWAEIDEEEQKEESYESRMIEYFTTGSPLIPETRLIKRKHINTVFLHNETFVLHLYDRIDAKI